MNKLTNDDIMRILTNIQKHCRATGCEKCIFAIEKDEYTHTRCQILQLTRNMTNAPDAWPIRKLGGIIRQ